MTPENLAKRRINTEPPTRPFPSWYIRQLQARQGGPQR